MMLTTFCETIITPDIIFGYENNNIEFLDNSNNLLEYSNKSPYLIDSGDVLNIFFVGLEIFSGNYGVDPDGFIFIPEIEKFYVRGKSIKELKDSLNIKYLDFIKNPEIAVNLISARPVNILIKGEVKRAGLYTLSYKQETLSGSNKVVQNASILYAPKVFDALQMSRGLKLNADISKVIVIRDNSEKNGGGKIKTTLNFLSLLNEGDQKQNIDLRDGDTIIVPKSDQPLNKQVLTTYRTNINPELIKVYMNGNVYSPGAKGIPNNSSLNEAIAIAGGRRMSSGIVEFIRFDDYGNLSQKKLKYDLKSPKGSKNNPILMDGDMIMVRKNIFGKTTETLSEVGQPIFSGYGLYRLMF